METKNEKREALIEASQKMAEMKRLTPELEIFTINELLKKFYYQLDNKELNTYHQWAEKGYQVKKGEKSFTFWATPKKIKEPGKKEQPEPDSDTDEKKFKYFPICYLFTNEQVKKID